MKKKAKIKGKKQALKSFEKKGKSLADRGIEIIDGQIAEAKAVLDQMILARKNVLKAYNKIFGQELR